MPAALVSIAHRAMAREVPDRYSSADALARELRAYIEGRVVKAHETGWLPELRSFVRRHAIASSLVSLALVAMLVAILALVDALDDARSANAERDVAQTKRFREFLGRAVDRGDWQTVLDATPPDDPLNSEAAMARCRAMMALGRFDEAVDLLESTQPPPRDRGLFLLLHAEIAASTFNADPVEVETYARKALEFGLEGAEQLYARALLAATSEEALDLLAEALALDPSSYSIRSNRCNLLLLFGHLDQAKVALGEFEAAYPDDVTIAPMKATLLVMRGQRPDEDALTRLDEPWPDIVSGLQALMESFSDIYQDARGKAESPGRASALKTSLASLLSGSAAGLPALKLLDPRLDELGRFPGLGWPVVRKHFDLLLEGLLAGLVISDIGPPCRAALEIHAGAEAHALLGLDLIRRNRKREAALHLADARTAPAILPFLRRIVLERLLAVVGSLGYGWNGEGPHPRTEFQLRETVHEFLAISNLTDDEHRMAFRAAMNNGDELLSRTAMEAWLQYHPNSLEAHHQSIQLENRFLHFYAMRERAREVASRWPDDAEAARLKKRTEEILAERAGN